MDLLPLQMMLHTMAAKLKKKSKKQKAKDKKSKKGKKGHKRSSKSKRKPSLLSLAHRDGDADATSPSKG